MIKSKQSEVYLKYGDLKNKFTFILPVFLIIFFFSAYNTNQSFNLSKNAEDTLISPGEKHFKNMKMLTNGGENAEAYFSYDGTKLIFQSTRDNLGCDQIFTMNIDGSNVKMVSNGQGRTTCSYFFPDDKHILYSSTYLGDVNCPAKPDFSKGYVWALYKDFDIFKANEDGSNITPMTTTKGYDAEATISPRGNKIVFTSTRDGDIDLYSMDLDGSNVKRLTFEPGYDGGAYFSYDGSMIVWRSSRPKTDAELKDYKDLLETGLIRPSTLEIYVMNADGSNKRQVTNNSSANFGPYFYPDGKKIIFCSNLGDSKGRNFDLYSINIDGTGLEQITYNSTFDGFPMFSMDGKKFVFCSNRFNAKEGETNVFICDWVD